MWPDETRVNISNLPLSDHKIIITNMILLTSSDSVPKNNSTNLQQCLRQFSECRLSKLKGCLDGLDWLLVFNKIEVEKRYKIFFYLFSYWFVYFQVKRTKLLQIVINPKELSTGSLLNCAR